MEQFEKHYNKEKLCYKCNNLTKSITKFSISNRGFGSFFEGDSFTINLCTSCSKQVDSSWFDNDLMRVQSEEFDIYNNEDRVIKLVKQFPIENQEYIWNCENTDFPSIDRDEWIKFEKILKNQS